MRDFSYINDFENLGFGIFVHFGVYSVEGKGEWYRHMYNVDRAKYDKLIPKFKVNKDWAKKLVKAAKSAGAKYITLTTRHHDGFSLYDTKGLNDYDTVHSMGRDLVREFVDACNEGGIVPFFYHTLLDWYNADYTQNFPAYIDYLIKSVEILCSSYGKIGGLWFDGMWNKPDADWQEDRLYATIRKYQPTAMIINNSGMCALGKVGNYELDSVTFERGKPGHVESDGRPRASEMCQVFNDHWGYAKNDFNYKSLGSIIEDLVDCRAAGSNFLLNVGPMGNGKLRDIDAALLSELGKWVKFNKEFIYKARPADITADGAQVLFDGKYYYAAIKNVPMSADPDVAKFSDNKTEIKINTDKKVVKAAWLDNGKRVRIKKNAFMPDPFFYGYSGSVRILRFELEG